MLKKQGLVSYNPYFLLPFLIWLLVGAALLFTCTPQQLFTVVNTHYNDFGDKLMYYTTWLGEGITIVGVLLVLLFIKPLRNWWYFFGALFCVGIPPLITQLIKHTYDLPRPYNQYNKATWIHFSSAWGEPLMTNSFPSGHTTGAFAMFCYLSMLLTSKYRSWGIIFFLLALMVGYSRIYLAAHFFRDVYMGSIIGTIFSLLVFIAVKKYQLIYTTNNTTV